MVVADISQVTTANDTRRIKRDDKKETAVVFIFSYVVSSGSLTSTTVSSARGGIGKHVFSVEELSIVFQEWWKSASAPKSGKNVKTREIQQPFLKLKLQI